MLRVKGFKGVSNKLNLPATGGDIVYVEGGHAYHVFNTSGTFILSASRPYFDFLLVGGGGGGAGRAGGGGGGIFLFSTSFGNFTSGTYSIVVGAGGYTGNGGDSSIGAGGLIFAGFGGQRATLFGSFTVTDYTNGGTTVGGYNYSQGNDDGEVTPEPGGAGYFTSTDFRAGGGGGGAGNAGQDGIDGGNGGAGYQWLNGNYYSGGGSGWKIDDGVMTYGTAGIGGGGQGVINPTGDDIGGDGDPNTGGGAGTRGGSDGRGGSGIVIIRYAL